MAWKAHLEGQTFDLEELAARLPASTDPSVVRDSDGEYYLQARALDGLADAGAVQAEAQPILDLMNGVMLIVDPNHHPVALSGHYKDGSNVHVVGLTATITARARVGAVAVSVGGEVVEPPPSVEPRYLALALSDDDVTEALLGMAGGPLDWPRLYKAYEVIRGSYGNERKLLAAAPWTTKTEVSAFTGSANRPDVSGEGARHARFPGAAPKHTMTLEQGQQFILRLLRHWMDSKL
jgi:hypothetical protein